MGPTLLQNSSTTLSLKQSEGYSVGNRKLYTKYGIMRPNDIKALTCGICSKILRDPIQLITCGCRYCNTCIQDVIGLKKGCHTLSDSFKCPNDGDLYTKNDIRKDKGCLKEIEQLEIDCQSQPESCGWRGPLISVEKHLLEDCPNVPVTCKNGCGLTILRSNKNYHDLECPKREETCTYCLTPVPNDELQDHYSSCPSHPMSCDFCKIEIPQRKDFGKHLEEVCNECELTCPMAKVFNCTFKGKRSEMAHHSLNSHLMNVMEKVGQLSLTVVTLQSDNESLHVEIKQKDGEIFELKEKVKTMEEKMSEMMEKIVCRKRLSLDLETDSPRGETRHPSPMRGVEPSYSRSNSSSGSGSKKSSTSISRRDYDQKAVVPRVNEAVGRHENQIAQLHENMQSLQQNITQYSIAVDELRLRQDVQDVKTTNGVFIWKIPDIRRRYRDALDRKTVSLYSPPFYTSPHGYRMCVRVYLNGDGAGKGTYLSLFFVLMRSEHDDLLGFPFKQSVRFTLINQSNPAENISEAFAPDLRSKSFQKPETDMNIASGFPKFARQTVLHDEKFTQGNAIYIKTKVDLGGLALD